jgi:Sugar kinases, ribokinase family
VPRVVVIGSVNLDLVTRVPALPRPGETVLGDGLARLSGGKGGNQAAAAARTAPDGVQVAMVACVGDDEAGTLLRRDLADAGVDIAAVGTVPGPSGTALIAVDPQGENSIVVVPGANAAWPDDALDAVALGSDDVVLLQLEVPFAIVETAVARASAAGARVVLNAAPSDPRVAGLLDRVDVLVVNEGEAAALFDLDRPLDVATAARLAADAGLALVVTLGSRGAVAASADGSVAEHPALVVEVVDTTGAGDAFVGALAAALAGGAALDDAVRWGTGAGAFATTAPGARHPGLSRNAVERLLGTGA